MNWMSTKLWSDVAMGGAGGSVIGAYLPHFSPIPAVPLTSVVTSLLGVALAIFLFKASPKS